ncbi:MAG: FlgD immunoglobulin-like domain containing protein, partial [Rubricoccaceae bacterium]|nr:FlgD immunoglobulin-like domain containing protein [Rubricoccaceae bacterium]
WRTVSSFRDGNGAVLPLADPGVFAVAVTGAGTPEAVLWAGTSEGILKSADGGRTWTVFRVNVPPAGDGTDEAPAVEAYAYPNPFTPGADGFCRIRYDTPSEAGTARVRIFDFGMRLVRTLDAPSRAGANEALWDGLSADGARVANGVYFYVVEAGAAEATGKILVLE